MTQTYVKGRIRSRLGGGGGGGEGGGGGGVGGGGGGFPFQPTDGIANSVAISPAIDVPQ